MGDVDLNMDFSKQVIVEAGKLDWVCSPSAVVDHIRLERENAESGRATTIVRFVAGSSFPPHTHVGDEEYFVLEGTFSNEDGDFGPGWYVRNPPGSCHTPASAAGCTIFLKLCQMALEGEPQVNIDTNRQA